tara:strand:+ start:49723 stop:50598 length:876 start_codon:yes stop_codon:yes gene_type:complete
MSTKKQKNVLGRGLDALLSTSSDEESSVNSPKLASSLEISINNIQVNQNQPRTNFDKIEINNLTSSIKDVGIIQPITVREIDNNKYEIISGERRYRASIKAGLNSIPCYIKGVENDSEVLKMSLVENIQRVDLDPIEIGLTYNRLVTDYNLDIDSISTLVGKDRSTISNYMRLLKLDPIIQSGIRDGFITMGHGRALINVMDKKKQIEIYKDVISSKLSVRQTEKIVNGSKQINNLSSTDVSKIYIDATNRFEKIFQSKVKLKENSNGKVYLSTYFKNVKELYSILKKISN